MESDCTFMLILKEILLARIESAASDLYLDFLCRRKSLRLEMGSPVKLVG